MPRASAGGKYAYIAFGYGLSRFLCITRQICLVNMVYEMTLLHKLVTQIADSLNWLLVIRHPAQVLRTCKGWEIESRLPPTRRALTELLPSATLAGRLGYVPHCG